MRLVFAFVLSFIVGAIATAPSAGAAGVVESQNTCIERPMAATAATNHASLVVTFGDGSTLTFCIEFGEDTITGAELLQRSGLSVVTASSGGIGAGICSIEGEGCNDPGDCFCKCKGGSCAYWVYYRYKDGAWQYSPVGAGNRTVRNGDADGWVWGSGGDPPDASGAVCPESAPGPSPAPSPLPSATPRPPATVPPAPTPIPAQESPASAPAPSPAAGLPAPPPPALPAAPPEVQPASSVLSAGRSGPGPQVAPSAVPGTPSSAATAAASRTAPSRTPAGAIQVSDDEGRRNLANQGEGGSWSWRGTVVFGGVAALLLGAGGAAVWRRRAGV